MNIKLFNLLGTASLLLGLPAAKGAILHADDWAQWRGPKRDGTIVSSRVWPDRLNQEHLRESWTVPLAPSYSGPLIIGRLVITTETVEASRERVRAYDRETGKLRWETSWEGSMKVPFFAAKNGSWIRSTPASDGELLFVMGMRDVLVALVLGTGEEIWRYDFSDELDEPLPAFGAVCSPLIDGNHLYVQAGAGFCKLDKRTGKLVWRTTQDKGGMFGSAFSSPVKVRLLNRDLLLVQAREALHGVNPDNGEVVFSQPIKAFRGMNIQTPLAIGDRIFTSSYGGRSQMWRAKEESGGIHLQEEWNSKHQGYMTSPVIIDGVIYNHLRNQRLVALDAQSGADLWNVSNRFGKYLSFVVNQDLILTLDQNGELFLFRASTKGFQKLDSRKVAEDSWAHLAVSGNSVAVRDLNSLTLFRWSTKSLDDKDS